MITFYTDTTPTSKISQQLVAELASYNLKGDWLNGEPTMDKIYWFAQDALSRKKMNEGRGKMANTMKIVREKGHVYLVVVGVMTGDERILCGFIEIKR